MTLAVRVSRSRRSMRAEEEGAVGGDSVALKALSKRLNTRCVASETSPWRSSGRWMSLETGCERGAYTVTRIRDWYPHQVCRKP